MSLHAQKRYTRQLFAYGIMVSVFAFVGAGLVAHLGQYVFAFFLVVVALLNAGMLLDAYYNQ